MAVSTTTSSITYSGTNAASQVCPVTFPFFAISDLSVALTASSGTITTLTQGSNYSVTGAGASSGGSVTVFSAVPSTTTIRVTRTVPTTQTTSFTTGDRFPASTMERALDKQVMMVQQTLRGASQTLRFSPDSDPISPLASAPTSGAYVLGTTAGVLGWQTPSQASLADGSVLTSKLADYNAEIANTGVSTGKIADLAVTTAKIAVGAITADRINSAAKIGGATGAGTDRTFYENDQSVNTDYTISASKNAMSAGPITVANGVTVTVPSGSTWSIV